VRFKDISEHDFLHYEVNIDVANMIYYQVENLIHDHLLQVGREDYSLVDNIIINRLPFRLYRYIHEQLEDL
jgi:hypothetical protein